MAKISAVHTQKADPTVYKALVLTVLVLYAGCALAVSERTGGTWFFSLDNDALAQSDDDYTSGIQIGWVSGYLKSFTEGPVPSSLGSWLDTWPMMHGTTKQRFISHSVSHRIFTPGDTQTSLPIEGDLPYSGLLFATFTAGAQDSIRMDAVSLHYGIVGPSARGDEIQNEFHRLINADPVNGWDNQLRDEPLINVNYEQRRRLYDFRSHSAWRGDVIGQAGGAVGNLISMATLGIGVRYGWNMRDDFAIPPQFFGEETIGSRPYSTSNRKPSVWFYALANGSYIGHAIFWDGNSYKDSPSVDYDPIIGRLYLGIAGSMGNWGASFAITKTTVPWENPEDKSSQTYGRVGITYSY